MPATEGLAGTTPDSPPVVGITADRRWQEQADLLRRRGLEVLHGPSMRTIDLAGDSRLRAVTEELIGSPPEWLVATTGMGIRQWFEAAAGWGLREPLLEALGTSRILARGAKSQSVLRHAGLDVAWRAPGESMAEIVDFLTIAGEAVNDSTVAIQLFDPDDHPATAALREIAGALVEVPVYRWLLPEDPGPAEHLIRSAVAGRLAAVTFTSQPAVRNLFSIARGMGSADGLRDAFNGGDVLAVCIGSVCAEAGAEVGLTEMVWPTPFRLPAMVRLVAERVGPPAQN